MGILVTGCAGFIGMHVAKMLLDRGDLVIGIDNMNDYYDPGLKNLRLMELNSYKNFKFINCDITNKNLIEELFSSNNIKNIIHLAGQPGVRYSLKNPLLCIQSNIVGFGILIECAKNYSVEHVVYASSSSVYGANKTTPFSVDQNVDHPVNLYAASKKSNELIAHAYSHLYGVRTTGLRYFTVYGPWGRPDMSTWLFTDSIMTGRPIDVFGGGKMMRDFTYVDDIARGTVMALDVKLTEKEGAKSSSIAFGADNAPYRLYNIGNNKPVELMKFIEVLESAVEIKANINFLPMQKGDMQITYADIVDSQRDLGFEPVMTLEDGLRSWINWYRWYLHR